MRVPAAVAAIALLVCGCSSGAPTNASDVSNTGATLNGHVFSLQRDTDIQYWFKYGPTTAYGLLTPEQTIHIPAQQTPYEPVSARVTGLTPFTTYHYQLCTAPPRAGCLQADKAFTAGPGLVFVSERASLGIWTMDAGGHDQARLAQQVVAPANPDVSSDGSKIAFAANFGGANIWVMDVDGGNPHPVTTGQTFSDNPAWSPDGKKIAFGSNRDGDRSLDIYVMDADGANVTRLTNSPGFDSEPTWSPDGTKIAFSSGRAGARTQIYSMDADGGNPTLLSDGTGDDRQPDWSPDGTKIAFSHGTGQPYPHGPGIWVIDADGGNPTAIADNARAANYTPVWSPDGTRIAFQSSVFDIGDDVYSVYADGTHQTRLTDSAAVDWQPDWIPRP